MIYSWLEPWYALPENSKKAFQNRLYQELASSHPLHGIAATPIGKNGGTDDMLFQLPNQQYAVVHLTWAGRGNSIYPQTTFFTSWSAFVMERMQFDHIEYI